MAVEAGAWAAEWERAKKAFEKNTKSKKPSDGFIKMVSRTTLSTNFKAMDKGFNDYRSAGGKKDLDKQLKSLDALAKALLAAKKACASYVKVIDAAWKEEVKKSGSKMKLDSLNVLEKDLEAIIVSGEAQLNLNKQIVGKRGKEMTEAVRSLNVLGKNLDATLKKGALFVAQNQRNSNGDEAEALSFFRENIMKAARDINQNVGNIAKLYPDGSVEKKTGDAIFKAMADWASKGANTSDIKAMKTKKDMLDLNGKMTTRIKAISEWRKKLKPPVPA
ncbi:hypothetical protein [Tritonibacter horizontis]|uniref:Uncharacterized protein n=1 Tax=Tritonibacter horizontis TaxID=1768241 RepID=A0A132BWC8_9RHOB|nr:hypothetical protein [Tritonibacter horizontis]KUP92678.1 hypothetical protein TRIHO_26510 [Tritonibacter horizontis]